MQLETARLVRQRFGIVRIAAGAFEDLAALDLPNARFALRNLQRAESRVARLAEALREEAFAAIRGCADVELRRRLLKAKRDLFNGRRVDASLPLPSMRAYAIACEELDAARAQFERAFDDDVAAARTKLHELSNSEALQRPLARSSLALLAEIRRGVTRRIETGLMKYVTRMHVKTSPFSTFCHVAVARYDVGQALSLSGQAESLPYAVSVRLGEARVTVRDDQYEDSVLEGEVVRDVEAITETIANYARDLAFSDPAIAIRRKLRREFHGQRLAELRLEQEIDPAIERWTAALASRLQPAGDTVFVDRQHVDQAFAAVPELRRELPRSLAAVVQFTAGGAVLNGCGPGYGRLASRFFDLLPAEMLEEQRAVNRGLVEFDDGSKLGINRHPLLVDEVIRDVSDLVVKIGDDDTLWLMRNGRRLEFIDLGLQEPAERSPMHQLLNTVFTRAEPVFRKPMVRAALAASRGEIMKPRVIYDRRLIIRRRSWHVPKSMLPVRASRERDAAYFARVDAWRESLGIPQYVFARVGEEKPQFLSFASWHSMMLFEKLLPRVNRTLRLQEMLPTPDDMLLWNGRRHAAEFVVQWTRA